MAAGVVTFLTAANLCWSPDWFGRFHDDSIYLSSAKALAQGQGYLMPSVPGEPPQTKYPLFYPWLLSLVWQIWPSFPQNLFPAFWINALGGAAFFLVCFFVLRQLGIGQAPALGLAAVCGLHPTTLHLATTLLSDLPFMALALGSSALAWRAAVRRRGQKIPSLWLLAGALAALAVMTRSMGIAFVLAVACFAGWRRSYRAAILMLFAGLIVFGAGLAWPPGNQSVFALDPASLNGYQQTRLFYGSYLGFWLHCVPDWATFQSMALFNLWELLKQPAAVCFLLPVVGFEGGFLQAVAVALSLGIAKGAFGLARLNGLHPLHLALFFTVPVTIAWNYTLLDRFLLPFLPLLLAGAYHEIRSILESVVEVFRTRKPVVDRVVSGILAAALGWLVLFAASGYLWRAPRGLLSGHRERASLAAEKQQAYRWILENTKESDRFISYEDATLWLYTGRQALRPMIFSTAAFYRQDEGIVERDLARFMDTASAIEAGYWLVAEDDYQLSSASDMIGEHVDRLLGSYSKVFETEGGRVRIYELSPPGAEAAAPGTARIPFRGKADTGMPAACTKCTITGQYHSSTSLGS